jgi:tetratricopeptide (TPR) repeat protein
VAYLAVPFQQNLFRAVLIVAGLVATMVKLATGTAGRSRSLAFYEKMYAEETAGAFENSPALRKKLVKGIRLFQENQPHKALKIFASLSQKCETRADFRAVYLFHALSLTSMGNHYGAIEVYERAVRLVPDYGRFYSNLGFAYMQTKNTEKAIEIIDEKILGKLLPALDKYDDYKIMVLPDHPTPIVTMTHASDPVPFMIYQKSKETDNNIESFNEETAKSTGNFVEIGYTLMNKFID